MPKINKPIYKEPCNGCGECCRANPCPAMFVLHPTEVSPGDPCPRLREVDGRYQCGLYLDETDPERREFIELATGILKWGCDSVLCEADDIRRQILGPPELDSRRQARAMELAKRFHPQRLVQIA